MIVIQCSCCNGQGVTPVTGKYLEAYELLSQMPNATGAQLAIVAGIQPTAMNNRLSWLATKGLATSELYGKEKRYKIL